MLDIYIVLALLVVVIILLLTNRVSQIGVGILILCVLTATGILKENETFGKLSDPIFLMYVGSFVISAAFTKVGLTGQIGAKTLKFFRRFSEKEGFILFSIAMATSILAIFLQALGVQIAMMTIVLTMADELHISRKKALLALGFSAGIGGTYTLIGNNVDLLARAVYLEAEPSGTFGFFEMSPLTIPMGILLIVLLTFVSSRWLKDDTIPAGKAGVPSAAAPGETGEPPVYDKKKQRAVIAITLIFIIGVMLDRKTPIPTSVYILISICALTIMKIMTVEEILRAINWRIILFAAGIMTLSSSLMKVGVGDYISGLLVNNMNSGVSLRLMVAIVYILANVMTQFMSNSGTFGIMAPIAVTLGATLALPIKPLVIAVCIGCNNAYATPLATPSLAMLAAAGNIGFKEFFKQGILINLVAMVLSILLIPILWAA